MQGDLSHPILRTFRPYLARVAEVGGSFRLV